MRTIDGSETLLGFQIEEDKKRKDAAAQIIGKNMVRIFFSGKINTVSYGMQQTVESTVANLANSELLPVPAFKVTR